MFGCWENRVKLIYTEKLLCSSRCFCFEKLYKFLLFFALLACFEELCSLFNTTYTCIYIWTLTHSHLYIYKYMYIITLWRLEIFFLSLLILLQIFSTSRKPNVSSDYVFVISSLITQEINDFFPKKEISLFWFLISNFWFSILDVFFFWPFWFRHFADMKKNKRTKMMMWSDVNDGDKWKPFSLQV